MDKPVNVDHLHQSTNPITFKTAYNQSDSGSLQPCIIDTDSSQVCAFSGADFLPYGGRSSVHQYWHLFYVPHTDGEVDGGKRAVWECEEIKESSQAVLGQVCMFCLS